MQVDLDDDTVDRYVVWRRTHTPSGCGEQVLAVFDRREEFQKHVRTLTRTLRREQRHGAADRRDCIGGSVLLTSALAVASAPAVVVSLRQRLVPLPRLRVP